MRNRLTELLPDTTPIKTDIVIEPSLAGAAEMLLSRAGLEGRSLLVVCDADALKRMRNYKVDAFVGVGSGTISDLCKYASFIDGKPYAVFPTAPSMNGYLSANASVMLEGVKESRPAHLPAGVFCDLGVIAGAPVRLLRSGLGDSLARPTAQADWLLSHLLLGTPYTALPFELLKPYETELFNHADKLVAGDAAVVGLLLKTLLVSGAGMVLAGGSYPASQGEHLIAHTMEMKHGDSLPETHHGEQIGVTTLTMAKIQQELLSRPLHLPIRPRWEDVLAGYLGTARARHIAVATRNKYALYDRYDEIAAKLAAEDAHIREALRAESLPEERLRNVLQKAQAPTTPAELGWSDRDYDIAVAHARFIRDRFTFLDLV
jgi:glycerol-1-phosphate dehydrogenase [NAD(P)+]